MLASLLNLFLPDSYIDFGCLILVSMVLLVIIWVVNEWKVERSKVESDD
jgi:hypothetical protein